MTTTLEKTLTLCIVFNSQQILLGMKKRGFGAGRWNGFGGKVEEGETIYEAAQRELTEEAGITSEDICKIGILNFAFQNDPVLLKVHVFKITKYHGTPQETEEMKPQWFNLNEVPFRQMWSDDVYWFPYLIQNKLFEGSFLFDKPATKEHASAIIKYELHEVQELK